MKNKTTKNQIIKWFTIILIVIFLIVTFWSFITLLWWNSSKKDSWTNIRSNQTISSDGISQ